MAENYTRSSNGENTKGMGVQTVSEEWNKNRNFWSCHSNSYLGVQMHRGYANIKKRLQALRFQLPD